MIHNSNEAKELQQSLAILRAKLQEIKERLFFESSTMTYSQVEAAKRNIRQYEAWIKADEAALASLNLGQD